MKRTVALSALWTASAGAAVGLGFLAVSLVDASASPGTTPVAATTSADSTPSTTPTPAPTDAPVPAPTPTSATGEFATEAGTAYANCTSGTPVVAGAAAPGWWVDDSDDPGEVEFENGTLKLEVHVVCVGGAPQFSVEGPRPDSRGGGDDADGRDDSDGRDGGGHGSDDRGGDDSGHGSDDSDDD